MILKDKTYDVWKWILFTIVPALNVLIAGLCAIYGWTWGGAVMGTIDLVAAFMGAILGVGSVKYKRAQADSSEG